MDIPAINWKPLGQTILDIIKENLKEYWHLAGVSKFMEETADRFAKWKMLASVTEDVVKRAEYEGNIMDINAQIDIKIASALMDLDDSIKSLIKKVLTTVGTFLLKIAAPLALAALGIPPIPI